MSWPVIFFGMFLGLAMLAVIYNVSLYVAMRERFLVWHSVRLIAMVLMSLVGSQLFLGTWLADPIMRNRIELLLLDVGIVVTGPFLVAYIEDGMLKPHVRRALNWCAVLAIIVSIIPPFLPDQAIPNALRHLAFVVIIILVISALVQALWMGSRAARFQLVAWSLILVVGGIASFHEIAFNAEWSLWMPAILVALTFEVVVSAVGVSDRFMILKRERDDAVAREINIAEIAATDPLTNLPNRRGLQKRLGDCKAPAPAAVALVDLDHFKRVNDTYGHDIGDKVLAAAASALVNENSFAARIGGEEFALLIYGNKPISEAESVRQKIADAVDQCVNIASLKVTASMGVCQVSDRASIEMAMQKADEALYVAKQSGRNRMVSSRCDVGKALAYRVRPLQAA